MSKDVMMYVGGSKTSFRCEGDGTEPCGANVFRRKEGTENKYECNTCGAVYTGEKQPFSYGLPAPISEE